VRTALVSACIGLAFLAIACDKDRTASVGVRELRIDDGAAHWQRAGFFLLSPALRLPSNAEASDVSQVWIRIPEGARIASRRDAAGARDVLVFPPGTEADRVETIDGAVADVRGTVLGEAGAERFHVYRRVGDALRGFEWPRDHEDAQRTVDDRLIELVSGSQSTRLAESERLRGINHCSSCHPHDKPENRVPFERGLPNRATDGTGFYLPASVFEEDVPLETYRPREMNVGDPFVTFHCDTGALERPEGLGHFRCSDGSVPRGHLDLARAVAAADRHAERVCASRCFLEKHMDEPTRERFATALAVCLPVCNAASKTVAVSP
jgi:hypothetical protein